MRDLKLYVLEETYNLFAGSTWPRYQEYLSGAKIKDESIQQEIDQFTEQQIRLGIKLKFVPNTEWRTQGRPENFDQINHDLEYKRKILNLPSVKTHMKNCCPAPWDTVTIDQNGRIFLCGCEGWLPYSVGNVLDFGSFTEIWSSVEAQKIQKSITDKTYDFCATDICVYNDDKDNKQNDYIQVILTIDLSCNLSCPSCRERQIFVKDSDIIKTKLQWIHQIKSWIEKIDKKVHIMISGGDPFASLIYRSAIEILAENQNVFFTLGTNGLLLKSHGRVIDKIINRLTLSISIDAATKNTYEKVRRGAKWEQLLENLEYAKTLGIPIDSSFVVQTDNFREMIPFIHFCREYNLSPGFMAVEDWGTWHNFEKQCVHLPTSPDYNEFKNIIDNKIFQDLPLRNLK